VQINMKFTTVSVILGAITATAEEVTTVQQDNPRPKMLEEVYGSPDSLSKIPKKQNRSARPGYFASRTADNCTFPLDVVILQDNTGSFADDYDQMRGLQLKLMTDALAAEHPGTRFALIPFRDKPVGTLGEPFDFCHRYDLPLADVSLEELDAAYANLWSNGGKDPAENQFGAIIAALESKQVGWGGADSIATKLIVLSTDAWPHFADDGLNAYGLTDNSGHLDEDEDAQCSGQYYPSPEQVQAAIANAGAYTAFLVFDGNYAGGQVVNSWMWFNNYIGQSEDFIEPLANDSSNFWEMLNNVIKAIEEEECVEESTTPVPTTTETTTTTTTATTTTTPAPTTTTTEATTTTTTKATTTPEPTVTPVAPTQAPETTVAPTEAPECSEAEGECPCPEVVIRLRHKPARMNLTVENTA
jgi:cell division septation protein DedD